MTEAKRYEAVARLNPVRVMGGIQMVEYEDGVYVRYSDHATTVTALDARVAELEGEVSRLRAIADAARVYFDGYCQDEADDEITLDSRGHPHGRWTGCHSHQIRDARALKEALSLEPTDGR